MSTLVGEGFYLHSFVSMKFEVLSSICILILPRAMCCLFHTVHCSEKGIEQSLNMKGRNSPCYLVEKFFVNNHNCLTVVFSL